jgi:hypothetical protein
MDKTIHAKLFLCFQCNTCNTETTAVLKKDHFLSKKDTTTLHQDGFLQMPQYYERVVQPTVKKLKKTGLCISNASNTNTPTNCNVLDVSFTGNMKCLHSTDTAFDVEVK